MPRLREGAIGDLILPENAVLDGDWVAPLRETEVVPLLDEGQTLLLAMRQERMPADLRKHTLPPEELSFAQSHEVKDYRFIRVTLTKALGLILRGTKKAVLSGGACHIPSLDAPAMSINHAYILVSTVYEPERRSHTGNVFQRCYYFHQTSGQLWPLGSLRDTHEAKYEEKRLLSKAQRAEKMRQGQEGTLRSNARQPPPSDESESLKPTQPPPQVELNLDLS